MKLIFLLQVLFTAGLFAAESFSQATKVTITADSSPFLDVLSDIEKQTDYLFVYDKSDIDLEKKITLSARNKPVAEVLYTILRHTNLAYAVEGNNIMLMKKPQLATVAQQTGKTVTGIVTDANGGP
ncbi:MAG: STN domain-containing protein, partial [Tannerellaceae bacterium]|nr:STN domain-containing protein [Tannerellaceae bacterium]